MSQIRISLAADDEMVFWQERLVHARELFLHSGRVSHSRDQRSVPDGESVQQFGVDREMTEGQGDWDGQKDHLVARWLPPLCSCAGRRFGKLVRDSNHQRLTTRRFDQHPSIISTRDIHDPFKFDDVSRTARL